MELKAFLAELSQCGLTRGTVANVLSVVRSIFNYAVDDEIINANPAARLGRFKKNSDTTFEGTTLTSKEVELFLESAKQVCPDYFPLCCCSSGGTETRCASRPGMG